MQVEWNRRRNCCKAGSVEEDHQVDDHNNRCHAPISLERTWATKFWPDRNFAWYVAVTEVNAALVHGHMQNGGKIIPQLEFRRALAKEMLTNNVGRDPESPSRPMRSSRYPRKAECELVTIAHFSGAYDHAKKKFKKTKQKYQKFRCCNFKTCKKMTQTYCKCSLGAFVCVGCFANHRINKVVNS